MHPASEATHLQIQRNPRNSIAVSESTTLQTTALSSSPLMSSSKPPQQNIPSYYNPTEGSPGTPPAVPSSGDATVRQQQMEGPGGMPPPSYTDAGYGTLDIKESGMNTQAIVGGL